MAATPFGVPGIGQRQNPGLQIPLHAHYHVGGFGIDSGIGAVTWEQTFGDQVDHLTRVEDILGYSPWALAWQWASMLVRARIARYLSESPSRCLPPRTNIGEPQSSTPESRDDTSP